MPYAHLAGKPDASVMAKPFILNTSMDSPEGSLSIRDPMATLFLDPSPTSNFLYPISFPHPMIHIPFHLFVLNPQNQNILYLKII